MWCGQTTLHDRSAHRCLSTYALQLDNQESLIHNLPSGLENPVRRPVRVWIFISLLPFERIGPDCFNPPKTAITNRLWWRSLFACINDWCSSHAFSLNCISVTINKDVNIFFSFCVYHSKTVELVNKKLRPHLFLSLFFNICLSTNDWICTRLW